MNATVRLSDADRARIAAQYGCAHVPEAVTVLPKGASSYALPVWCGAKNQLVYPDWDRRKKEAQMSLHNTKKTTTRFRADPVVTARRQMVADAHAEGLTTLQIAERLNLSQREAYADLYALGLKPHKAAPVPHVVPAAVIERRDRILAMADAGATARVISEAVGLSKRTIRDICRRFGRELKAGAPGPQGKPSQPPRPKPAPMRKGVLPESFRIFMANRLAQAAIHREQVIELARAGVTDSDAAAQIGLSIGQVRDIRRAAGMKRYNPRALSQAMLDRLDRAREAMEERRQRVAVMVADGMTIRQIATAIGVTEKPIRRDLRAMGLTAAGGRKGRPKVEKPKGPSAREIHAAMRQAVAAAVADRLNRSEIMAKFGISRATLYAHLKALGVIHDCPQKRRSGPYRGQQAKAAARKQMVVALLAQGLGPEAICDRMGAARTTIYRDLRELRARGEIAA